MSLSPISGAIAPVLSIVRKQQQDQARLLTELSSGTSITSAADNPSGLVISQLLQSQGQGDSQAGSNIAQAGALVQTAEGGLGQTQALLDQMRSLALQAASTATADPTQDAVLNAQFTDLGGALDRIAANTSFGQTPLLDGSYANQTVQTGAAAGQTLQISIDSTVTGAPKGFDSQGLGLAGANLSSPAATADALDRLATAADAVARQRGDLGALQANTLDSLASSLSTQELNLASSASAISDTDYAQASAGLAQNQILNQASMAMLVQGNLAAGQVLKLLA